MRAIQIERFGDPAQVLRVVDIEEPPATLSLGLQRFSLTQRLGPAIPAATDRGPVLFGTWLAHQRAGLPRILQEVRRNLYATGHHGPTSTKGKHTMSVHRNNTLTLRAHSIRNLTPSDLRLVHGGTCMESRSKGDARQHTQA